MRPRFFSLPLAVLLLPVLLARPAGAQEALRTPLPDETLQLLANHVSGQHAFNNLVKLAGAPWQRAAAELSGESNFYESEEIYRMVQAYGIETVRFDRYPSPGTFDYPVEGELWVEDAGPLDESVAGSTMGPQRIAWLPGDPALVASGSQTSKVTGPLVYLPQVPEDQLNNLELALQASPEAYRGAAVLMWSHPRGAVFEALDRAGVGAVISFNSRERYFDPDQVVYSRGSYAGGENLRLGLTISWRQWSELLEDVQSGKSLTVRARAVVEQHPNRYETVYAWIPGTEPDEKGVVFTAHLFEGYVKRGTNDNMGGPAIQLEILRALTHLIGTGQLPQPRRTIHFIWPNEISGTYEFLAREEGLIDRLSVNINMDMVSESLRENNGLFTMSETPAHLPSFFDGLAESILNYVWRTNDIVYLPDSPRGRPGGQYFPRPLWEKNGTRDAFRFFIHEATGGSDHIVFNNRSVGIPGIEFFTWPDQWYHADKDLPETADPTEMRRVAFIGAATAWVSAHLTDEALPGLLEEVLDFGYARVAERGLPRAMRVLERAEPADGGSANADGELDGALARALNIIDAAVAREREAISSVRGIATGSPRSDGLIADRALQWDGYGKHLAEVVTDYARARADALGAPVPREQDPTAEERRYTSVVPRLSGAVRGREFNMGRYEPAQRWFQEHPGALPELGLSRNQTTQILNFVDGRRSVVEIRNRVAAWTGEPLDVQQVADYLGILAEFGWVEMQGEEAP